ncbi:MAG: HAD family hydrolase [Polyangiaceae bacterium]|nr:HAD family hydrolase [Polyangiaceae bacterium]
MLRTLSLDAGGVLVCPNWRRIAAVFATHDLAVDPRELAAQELMVMRQLDSADGIRLSTDEARTAAFLTRVFCRTGVEAPPTALSAAVAELCRIHAEENLWDDVPADVVPALARFRALDLALVVLSNANGTVRKKFERLGMASWFAAIVDSGEEGVEKPDPVFFHRALARIHAEPATTLHVGDLYHVDVLGARAAGLSAVLIDRGGLQAARDCPRFADLGALATALEQGWR